MLVAVKSRLIYIAKLFVGLGLLVALLLIDDNWRKIIDIAADVQLSYLVPFVGVSALLIWISCIKWGLFIDGKNRLISTHRLMGLYVIGYFFNNFLPSTLGGDAARSYILGRQIDSQEQALATVFLERFTGFVAMVSLAIGAFMLNPALREEPVVLWSILFVAAITVGVIIVIIRPALLSRVVEPLPIPVIGQTLIKKALRFRGHIIHFRGEWSLITRAMAYSYGFYALAAIKVYVAGLLLGIDCNLAQLFVVTPIVMLIAAVPVTLNGLGIQEWGYSVYLIFAGATLEEGLAIALVLRVAMLIISVFGGVLFLFEKDPVHRAEAAEAPVDHESFDGQPGYEVQDPVN